MNSASDRTNQDLDPRTSCFRNSMPLHIAHYGYQSKPASLLQGIHFNTMALHCPPVLLKTQSKPYGLTFKPLLTDATQEFCSQSKFPSQQHNYVFHLPQP